MHFAGKQPNFHVIVLDVLGNRTKYEKYTHNENDCQEEGDDDAKELMIDINQNNHMNNSSSSSSNKEQIYINFLLMEAPLTIYFIVFVVFFLPFFNIS